MSSLDKVLGKIQQNLQITAIDVLMAYLQKKNKKHLASPCNSPGKRYSDWYASNVLANKKRKTKMNYDTDYMPTDDATAGTVYIATWTDEDGSGEA